MVVVESADTNGFADWRRFERNALLAGLAALVAGGLCLLFTEIAAVLRAYLVAFWFWLGIALGSLGILMLQYLTGGVWGLIVRRPLEAASRTLPLMAAAAIPLVAGAASLYPWADTGTVEHNPALQAKSGYLNLTGFVIRAAIYFAVWLTLSYFLNRWSAWQELFGSGLSERRFRLLSAPGLALFGLTITFAAIDWIMTLEPHWYSSIYGIMVGAGQGLNAFAFAIVVVATLNANGTRMQLPDGTPAVGPGHLRDLGSLLLAFVMVWAYLAFSQYLLIWSARLPEETIWYAVRLYGGWEVLAYLLVVFHFAVPFLLLLLADVKRHGGRLRAVAILLMAMRFVDLVWLIIPAKFHVESLAELGLAHHWLELVLAVLFTAGLGGVWLAWFGRQLRSRPLLPTRDPTFTEAFSHA